MRICPICEARMEEEKCPTHDVATVDVAVWESRQAKLQVGTVVGHRYRIERTLGDGGFGVVYLATQLEVDRQVALKVLRQDLESDARALKRFYREAKAASILDHPNIVRIFDFGFDDKLLAAYLVMEYVEGRTLHSILKSEGPMPEQRAASLLAEVASSLVAAHAREIVHRDLKPANIMVGVDGHAKVLDFGIAKILGDDSSKSLTHTGGALGTPAYMSPEQVNGKDVDFRSDLYSLGCLFHEMLTGAPPYDSERALAVMYQQVNDPPPPLPAILPGGDPPSTSAIELHAALLAKDRRARPSSTEEVATAFDAIAAGRPATLDSKVTLDAGVHNLVTAEAITPRPRWPKRFAIFSASAIAAVAAVFLWPASSQPIAPTVKPTTVSLSLESEPTGATVSIDGEPLGTTPHRIEVPADATTKTILFDKAGYLAVEQRVVTNTSHAIRVVLKPSQEGQVQAPKKEAPRTKPQRKLKTSR